MQKQQKTLKGISSDQSRAINVRQKNSAAINDNTRIYLYYSSDNEKSIKVYSVHLASDNRVILARSTQNRDRLAAGWLTSWREIIRTNKRLAIEQLSASYRHNMTSRSRNMTSGDHPLQQLPHQNYPILKLQSNKSHSGWEAEHCVGMSVS